MNRSEGPKKVGPPQKNSLDPLLYIVAKGQSEQCEAQPRERGAFGATNA